MEEKKLELSFSAIETYNLCPRKYYYNYILKLKRKVWPWLVFGTFVHLVLEKFHKYILYFRKRNRNFDYSELMKRAYMSSLRLYQKNGHKDPNLMLSEKQKIQAKGILKRHLNDVKQSYPNVFLIEKGFNLKIGEYIIKGYIDRVDKINENEYEVLDYKTSSKSYDINGNYQLSLYAYALKKILNNNNIKINKKFDFLKLNEVAEGMYKNTEDKKVEEYVMKNGKEISEKIKNDKNEEDWKPIDNNFCKYCDFKDRCFCQRGLFL